MRLPLDPVLSSDVSCLGRGITGKLGRMDSRARIDCAATYACVQGSTGISSATPTCPGRGDDDSIHAAKKQAAKEKATKQKARFLQRLGFAS